jgi:hypothetical protein
MAESNKLSIAVDANLSFKLGIEDVINVEAVKHEEGLRNQRKQLLASTNSINAEIVAKTAEAQKKLVEHFSNVYKKAFEAINKSIDLLFPSSKSKASVTGVYRYLDGAGVPTYTVTFNNTIGGNQIANIEAIPAIEKIYAVIDTLQKEYQKTKDDLRAVDTEISNIPFQIKKIRAQITENALRDSGVATNILQLAQSNS